MEKVGRKKERTRDTNSRERLMLPEEEETERKKFSSERKGIRGECSGNED